MAVLGGSAHHALIEHVVGHYRDDARVRAVAVFGPRAVITVTRADSADVVLDSAEEISIRWHALAGTSPNIAASVRVVHGEISDADLAAAGEANRIPPDPAAALAAVLAETQAHYDLGPRRRALLALTGAETDR